MTHAVPTREDGLQRLEEFLPLAGRDYAELRNHVPGVVSGLAPYVRTRLLTEEEITCAVLKRHSYKAAEKFLQEVCWRTYWKGWLEMRPEVWLNYLQDLQTLRGKWDADSDARNRLQAAERGETGLECMDAWVKELKETGYLHNHVRMWFASIWVHTLRLPWQLGADFFMRHLLDGDPASNTLSWRWVCGLQTKGKVYQATSENIERYTNGRHAPHGLLVTEAVQIPADHPIPNTRQLLPREIHPQGEKTFLLVTEEDLYPESWCIPMADVEGVILIETPYPSSDAATGISNLVSSFRSRALESTKLRMETSGYPSVTLLRGSMQEQRVNLRELLQTHQPAVKASITMMGTTVGTTRMMIDPVLAQMKEAGISLRRLRREWDDALWPHATHGFFRFKEQIPSVLERFS